MEPAGHTFVIRQLSEREADQIVVELGRVERAGHRVIDVRHEGGVWRIYARERRFHEPSIGSLIAFRRRASD